MWPLNFETYLQMVKLVTELRKTIRYTEIENNSFDPFESGILIAHAYPERIASARPGNNARFQLANGRIASAFHRDDLAHEAWLAIAHLDARDGQGKIFLASPLNPKDLAPLIKKQKKIKWNTDII